MEYAEMSQTEQKLLLDGREFTLLGTAHISTESIADVTNCIASEHPNCVAVELDEKRYNSMMNPAAWSELNIISVLKKKEGFLLLANLVLASFQRRMGRNVGVRPGDEMKAAV